MVCESIILMPPRTQFLPVAGFSRRIRESPRRMMRGLRAKHACPRVYNKFVYCIITYIICIESVQTSKNIKIYSCINGIIKLSFLKSFFKLRFVDIFVSLKIVSALFSLPLRLKREALFLVK